MSREAVGPMKGRRGSQPFSIMHSQIHRLVRPPNAAQARTAPILAWSCSFLALFIMNSGEHTSERWATGTSINFGVPQQPITDINQLLPKLCQNQSVICEGSFCIPGIRKCVCDLRMPVQFGRYCLRQVDIETKCFATSQCNHTVKDAVCIGINSNAILDVEASRLKLDQWQQLHDLKQKSQSTLFKNVPRAHQSTASTTTTTTTSSTAIQTESAPADGSALGQAGERPTYVVRDDVIKTNALRNSPYEIQYDTPDLMIQNHTRRRNNQNDKAMLSLLTKSGNPYLVASQSGDAPDGLDFGPTSPRSMDPNGLEDSTYQDAYRAQGPSAAGTPQAGRGAADEASLSSTTSATSSATATTTTSTTTTTTTTTTSTTTTPTTTTTTTTMEPSTLGHSDDITTRSIHPEQPPMISGHDLDLPRGETQRKESPANYGTDLAGNKRKAVVKTPQWPPGICACPAGFMFDSMLRKCLSLSLADSHCLVDADCKQIASTHCSRDTRKCECNEPFVWEAKQSACIRAARAATPRPLSDTARANGPASSGGSFLDNLLPPMLLAKLLPDYSMLLFIFVILIIVATVILLKVTVTCVSSTNSALISPTKNKTKQHKSKHGHGHSNSQPSSHLPPRSPYATLRRPDHKPSSQLSNFTQATRGRILNYDFEQETPTASAATKTPMTPQHMGGAHGFDSRTLPHRATLGGGGAASNERGSSATMRPNKGHRHHHHHSAAPKEAPDAGGSDGGGGATAARTNGAQLAGDEGEPAQFMELNDNISLGQLEGSEASKRDELSSTIMSIPGPPPSQQPPYMLASSMRLPGQGAAIAAAAAAVANKRMQLAQKKSQEQQQQAPGKLVNGSPVFL